MTDRELLERAAKAAGLTAAQWVETEVHCGIDAVDSGGQKVYAWNPLEDDGDAFRLMAALSLEVKFLSGLKQVACRRREDSDNFEMYGVVGYGKGADQSPALENIRRAIVRAAAMVGGMTLPHDIARCQGVQYDGHWREGCERCLRRTEPGGKIQWSIDPPAIIAFECEYLIEPPPAD